MFLTFKSMQRGRSKLAGKILTGCSKVCASMPVFILLALVTTLAVAASEQLFSPDLAGFITSSPFGLTDMVTNTLLIAVAAVILALPLAFVAAVYVSEYASLAVSVVVRSLIDSLSSIPSVVYAYVAVVVCLPWFEGLDLALAADYRLYLTVILVAVMIVPMAIGLVYRNLRSIPRRIKLNAAALGATKFEILTDITLPAIRFALCKSSLVLLLRGLGETIVVSLVLGLSAKLTLGSSIVQQASVAELPYGGSALFVVAGVLLLASLLLSSVILLLNDKAQVLFHE